MVKTCVHAVYYMSSSTCQLMGFSKDDVLSLECFLCPSLGEVSQLAVTASLDAFNNAEIC